MKRIPKTLVLLCASAALAACSVGGGHRATGHVVLIQRGSRATNAYALAYQTCATTPVHRIVADVMAPSIDPSAVASSLARASFAAPVRVAAARGCLDALQGRAPHPRG
jgi:hypothetical protein